MTEPPADGIFCDATLKWGRCAIAVILKQSGEVVDQYAKEINIPERKCTETAEVEAILWARRLFPFESVFPPIYTDNYGASKRQGVNWIPREWNQAADSHSRSIIRPGATPKGSSRRGLDKTGLKMKKKFRRRGRGVMHPDAKRTF